MSAPGKSSLPAILLELLPAVLFCALFVAVGIMHVTSRVLVVDVGYQLSKREQESRDLSRERDRLKLELATLKSPAKLEQLVRERLKMQPPSPGTVFTAPLLVPPTRPATTAVRPAVSIAERGG
jgi:cell division protein FtsL